MANAIFDLLNNKSLLKGRERIGKIRFIQT